MKSTLLPIWSHIWQLYRFSHDGEGLPKHKSSGLAIFALGCLLLSLACQFGVLQLAPGNFVHMATSETIAAVLVLYIPGLCSFALQRAESVFSLCVLYLGFSFSGLMGALLLPAIGELGAWLSLSFAAWGILAYLVFTPKALVTESSAEQTTQA